FRRIGAGLLRDRSGRLPAKSVRVLALDADHVVVVRDDGVGATKGLGNCPGRTSRQLHARAVRDLDCIAVPSESYLLPCLIDVHGQSSRSISAQALLGR